MDVWSIRHLGAEGAAGAEASTAISTGLKIPTSGNTGQKWGTRFRLDELLQDA